MNIYVNISNHIELILALQFVPLPYLARAAGALSLNSKPREINSVARLGGFEFDCAGKY